MGVRSRRSVAESGRLSLRLEWQCYSPGTRSMLGSAVHWDIENKTDRSHWLELYLTVMLLVIDLVVIRVVVVYRAGKLILGSSYL